MRIRDTLRKINRTVLEIDLGILGFALLFQVGALLFAPDRLYWCLSFLLGSVLAVLAIRHMYRTLDYALDLGEEGARKMIYRGYVTRYLALVLIIMALIFTKLLDPLLVFLSYMSMKAAVYLQPLTHKLCNRVFRDEDSVPGKTEEEHNTRNEIL